MSTIIVLSLREQLNFAAVEKDCGVGSERCGIIYDGWWDGWTQVRLGLRLGDASAASTSAASTLNAQRERAYQWEFP